MSDNVIRVLHAGPDAGADDVRTMLRDAAALRADARDAGIDNRTRAWAVLGELAVGESLTENEQVVEHDLIGRLVVRLRIDKTLCVGTTRAVRAMYQGAIMEGSWGDEAAHVRTVDDAIDLMNADSAGTDDEPWRPEPGDIVVVAGPTALGELIRAWPRAEVAEVAAGGGEPGA